MANTVVRRPLPALIALLALLLLTGIVWWRVLNRGGGEVHRAASTCTSSPPRPTVRELPPPGRVDVLVLNATTRSGIAAQTRKSLVHVGFRSPQKAANDLTSRKKTVTGVAQIRYGAAGRSGALLVRYYFPGAQLVAVPTSDPTVTISLGPRYKKVASAATVRTAMATDHARITTATPTPSSSASATCSS